MLNFNKEAKLKDKILSILHKPPRFKVNFSTTEIAEMLNEEHYLILYLADDLAESQLVDSMNITSKGTDIYGERSLRIKAKGRYFLEFGGYSKIARKEFIKQIWEVAKIVAAVINAVAIIYIAYLGLK